MLRTSTALALVIGLATLAASACGGIVSDPNGHSAGGVGGSGSDPGTGFGSSGSGSSGSSSGSSGSTGSGSSDGGSADVSPGGFTSILTACDPKTETGEASFSAFEWSREHPDCGGSSKCTVFVQIATDCSLSVEADGVPRTTGLAELDCRALKQWTTSARLLDGLRDPTICDGGLAKGNPEEMTTTYIDGGGVGRKIDPSCTAEPFAQNRACLQAVLDVYAPGVNILP